MKTGAGASRTLFAALFVLISATVAVLLIQYSRRHSGSGRHQLLGSVVTVERVLKVDLPEPAEQWEAVTNARLDEYTPRPVLLLFHRESPALVRFLLRPRAEGTPAEIARQFADQFTVVGHEWSLVCEPDATGGRCVLIFEAIGTQPAVKGKIWVETLPGDATRTLVLIGVWPPGQHDRFEGQIDHMADHVSAAD